ncbi:MAG: PIN domain-containing protein, partial [Candidatus Woesebacteria bacterium]
MKKSLIDTNLIIRFLVNDDPKKAFRVKSLFLNKKTKNILLDVIVAEIIWVLSSYYELEKLSVIEKVRALIHLETVECNKDLIERSLSIWERNNISYIDSYIAAFSEIHEIKIYSYD